MSDYIPASEDVIAQGVSPMIVVETQGADGSMGTTGEPLGSPLEIPDFTLSGVLPPYMGPSPVNGALMSPYITTLVHIADRMCGSAERQVIFSGLLSYRRVLADIGLQDGFQWLSGSFIEDIETLESRNPKDVDVVTFVRRPVQFLNDDTAWFAFIQPYAATLDHDLVKAQYHCDTYFVELDTDPFSVVSQARYWFGLFSHRRGGLWKGMLQVPLGVTQDDTDALARIVATQLTGNHEP